ncbi:hypothetical protein A2392_00040 [Candidatus Kaiserbacteria bacterium RIFOXYB1_FULL_46_14]|uniref:Phage holin family protein n=1 Tax=Candidatus Kaiserbacteria bacterium RIFOXYB1_FULL_46_14 TaxID=1798531 RepID=A0A1F6FHX9_9BACT|nr:MAG: hypothetical protein A2392_00040 [Candidatus Kaiserbacteria bacterium RIFOXYB1_FULL_46_14]
MQIIVRVLVVALALLLAAEIIPGVEITGLYTAILAAVVLGIINLIIRPVLFILTLPLTIITFGLFALVLNAVMVLLATLFVDSFNVDGFIPALLCSFFVAIASALSNKILSD